MRTKKFAMLICLVSIMVVLGSCVNSQKPENKTCEATHIETFFTDFMSRHKDGYKNDSVQEITNKEFKAEISDSLTKSSWLIEDFPARLEKITKLDDNKYSVHFESWVRPEGYEIKCDDLFEVSFDILGMVDESYINKLEEKKHYYVHGRLIRFMEYHEFAKYSDLACASYIGLKESMLKMEDNNSMSMQMGQMLFQIDSISPYKAENK